MNYREQNLVTQMTKIICCQLGQQLNPIIMSMELVMTLMSIVHYQGRI